MAEFPILAEVSEDDESERLLKEALGARILYCVNTLFLIPICANIGREELDKRVYDLCAIIEIIKLLLFAYWAFPPHVEYKLMGREVRCAAEIFPVALGMALSFVLPFRLDCFGLLFYSNMQFIAVRACQWGIQSIRAWDIFVTMPAQLLFYWFTATKIIHTNHPFVFSAMALGFWATLSIFHTRSESVQGSLDSKEYAALPDDC